MNKIQKKQKSNTIIITFAYIASIIGGLNIFNFIYDKMWQHMNSTTLLSYLLLTLVLLVWGIYTIKEIKGKKIFESAGTWISLSVLVLLIFGTINADESSEDLHIDDIVKSMKDEISLPLQVDEVTKIIDITAEENAIRFHYTVNIGVTQLVKMELEEVGTTIACQDAGIRSVLEEGINMEFSYTIENSNESYLISVNEKDCL